MAFYKLHNIRPTVRVGEADTHFGYRCEVREDGVYADIPDELIETEMASGRVREVKLKEQVVNTSEVPVAVDEPIAKIIEIGNKAIETLPFAKSEEEGAYVPQNVVEDLTDDEADLPPVKEPEESAKDVVETARQKRKYTRRSKVGE